MKEGMKERMKEGGREEWEKEGGREGEGWKERPTCSTLRIFTKIFTKERSFTKERALALENLY